MNLPNPRLLEAAELHIREQERKRDRNLSWGDTSTPSQRKRLSRRVYVLIEFVILLLIIVGIVIMYHFLH